MTLFDKQDENGLFPPPPFFFHLSFLFPVGPDFFVIKSCACEPQIIVGPLDTNVFQDLTQWNARKSEQGSKCVMTGVCAS